jgi:transposase
LGRRAGRLWPTQDALQQVRALGGQRLLDAAIRDVGAFWRAIAATDDRLFGRQSPPFGVGRKRGEKNQAIGRSRGGRTTKIHALTDERCRPVAFLLTGGQVPDCVAAQELLDKLPECAVVNGDKGYDSDGVRRTIKARGALANIPPKANRKEKLCFSPFLYRDRNSVERMFCRLKDFRRIATRYDRNAANFLAAVCLAAAVSYWL